MTQDTISTEKWMRQLARVAGDGYQPIWPETLRAWADEIERLRSMTVWQPIETAPKDGTHILVWRALEKGYESRRMGVDFWRVSRGLWWKSRRDMQPTHWLPLPTPPES